MVASSRRCSKIPAPASLPASSGAGQRFRPQDSPAACATMSDLYRQQLSPSRHARLTIGSLKTTAKISSSGILTLKDLSRPALHNPNQGTVSKYEPPFEPAFTNETHAYPFCHCDERRDVTIPDPHTGVW